MSLKSFSLALGLVGGLMVADHGCAAEDLSEASYLENVRQLTYEGLRSGEGYFSDNGELLIFQSEREPGNPFYQMYTLDLTSGDTQRVSSGTGKTTCGFFQPHSDRLIYSSTHEDPSSAEKQTAELEFRASGKQRRYSWDYDAAMEIYSAKRDGSAPVNLTRSIGYDAEGAFSPDGAEIVFCSLRSAFPLEHLNAEERARYDKDPAYWGEIYVMRADGSDVRRLTNSPGYDGGPFFSPDGKRIVWRHFDESGMIAEIWTMNRDGSDKHKVTSFQCMSWAPYFHPSGKYLIFTANKLGFENFELFMVDVDGHHEPVRVTYSEGFDGLPVFSPDGTKLCWASGRTSDHHSQLFFGKWNHAEALRSLGLVETSAERKPGGPIADAAALLPAISAADLKSQVDWLADETRQGRLTGSPEIKAAATWLSDYFSKLGLKPLPGLENFYNGFEFAAGQRLQEGRNTLFWNSQALELEKDFRPLASSENGEAEGEVIYAGYGLNVPEGADQAGYNSYEGLDVRDKVVLIFRYVPEGVEPARRAHLNRYAGLRYKVMMARERGAKAVIVVTGPNSPNAGELLPMVNDGTTAASGILAASISGDAAVKLLSKSGRTLKELQDQLDTENPHNMRGFLLPDCTVRMSAGIEHIKGADRNVVACLPGQTDEWVIVGAHYDHLGHGIANSSLAKSGEEQLVHPGADDNASGTAAVMEIAGELAATKPLKRGIIFALWSGEEMGLVGSHEFVEKPPVPLSKVVAYVNFDMVGRLRDNHLIAQATGSSKEWVRLLEKRNVAAGFNLGIQQDPYLPTDVTSFYPKKIPVLNFFTGSHDDYHRPSDTADKVNFDGLERITRFAAAIVQDIAGASERVEFSRVERKEEGGGRDAMRVYLGTIPDYATEVVGVKLTGVREGSPAQKAGLKGGDIIVEFGAQKVKNIYDYTYALEAVKIGQPVLMAVEREGKRVELTVTPEARK